MAEIVVTTPTKPKFNYSLKPDFDYMWPAALGLALEGCAGEASRFVFSPDTPFDDAIYYIGRIGCLVIALIAILAARRLRSGFVFSNRAWAIAVCVLFSLGLALFYQDRIFIGSIPWLALLGRIVWVCSAFVYLLIWFDRMFAFGLRDTMLTVGASLMLRGGLQIVLLFMQDTPAAAILVLLPLFSLPFFLKVFNATDPLDPKVSNPRNLPYQLSFKTPTNKTCAMYAFGVMIALLALIAYSGTVPTDAPVSDPWLWRQVACVSANLVTGLLLFLTTGFQFSKTLLSAFLLGVSAVLFIGLFLSASTGPVGVVLSTLLLSIARKCMDFIVLFPAFIFSENGEVHYSRHAMSRFLSGFGSMIAYILAANLRPESELSSLLFGVFSALFFAALIVLFVVSESVIAPAATREAAPEAERIHHPFRDALDKIAADAQLTSTESTILNLIARGHNAESVRQELIISVNTAKTHIRNIYAKLNIHSQQELIALVNETKAQIVEEYRSSDAK